MLKSEGSLIAVSREREERKKEPREIDSLPVVVLLSLPGDFPRISRNFAILGGILLSSFLLSRGYPTGGTM